MKTREYNAHINLVVENLTLEELVKLEDYIRSGFDQSPYKLIDIGYVVGEGRDRSTKGKKAISSAELLEMEKSKGASCGTGSTNSR